MPGEALVIQREPAFIHNQQRRATVEAVLDAMEEIGEHSGSRAGADQPFGLEDLNIGFAQMLGLGVEQTAIGPVDAIGPERLLEIVGLQQDGQSRQRALGDGRRR